MVNDVDVLIHIFYIMLLYFKVSEMAVSELPGNPNAVWTVKLNKAGTVCTPGFKIAG